MTQTGFSFPNKKTLIHVGYFFLFLAVLMFLVALPTIIPHTLTATQKQSNVASNIERRQTVTVYSIFANNFLIAVFTVFPFAGWLFVGIVMFKTGLVVASYNQPVYWVLTSVFSWVELSVYSISILGSIQILQYYLKRKTLRFWHSTTKIVIVTLGVAALTLFVSAVWEYLTIKA